MDVSNLNLNNRQLAEEHHLSNARAFLEPGLACLMPYAVRAKKRIPGWTQTMVSHLATPRLGADFLECELCLFPGGKSEGRIVNPYENFMFVVEGCVNVNISGKNHSLDREGFFLDSAGS